MSSKQKKHERILVIRSENAWRTIAFLLHNDSIFPKSQNKSDPTLDDHYSTMKEDKY